MSLSFTQIEKSEAHVLASAADTTRVVLATEVERAWAAGFVDGEGAIMITWSRAKMINRRGRREMKPDQFNVHVRVTQTCTEPLIKLVNLFGGQVKAVNMNAPSRAKNARPIYEWNIYGARAVAALEAMLPFFMVKGEQASLAIEFDAECAGTVDNFDTRKAYYDLMRELQQKGLHLRKDC